MESKQGLQVIRWIHDQGLKHGVPAMVKPYFSNVNCDSHFYDCDGHYIVHISNMAAKFVMSMKLLG